MIFGKPLNQLVEHGMTFRVLNTAQVSSAFNRGYLEVEVQLSFLWSQTTSLVFILCMCWQWYSKRELFELIYQYKDPFRRVVSGYYIIRMCLTSLYRCFRESLGSPPSLPSNSGLLSDVRRKFGFCQLLVTPTTWDERFIQITGIYWDFNGIFKGFNRI